MNLRKYFTTLTFGKLLFLGLVIYLFFLISSTETSTSTLGTVWDNLPWLFMPLYFIATLLLITIIMVPGKVEFKLVFIILHSALSHALVPILFPIGGGLPFGTDESVTLGRARSLYEGLLDVRGQPIFNPYYGPPSLLFQIYLYARELLHYTLSVVLGRIFFVDILWSHSLFIPTMWSVSIPLISYGIAKLLTKTERATVLSAFLAALVPSLVFMGARSIPNSLGLILFFFTLMAALRYLSFGKKTNALLFIIGAFGTVLSHYLLGALSFVLVFFTFIYRAVQKRQINVNMKNLFLFATFVVCIGLLPLSLYVEGFIHPTMVRSVFTLKNLMGIPPYDAISMLLFGEYATLPFSTALVLGLVPLFGFLGMVYGAASQQNRKAQYHFLLLLFAIIWIDYIILKCFMSGVPFSSERLWTVQALVGLAPMSVAIYAFFSFLKTRVSFELASVNPGHFVAHHRISVKQVCYSVILFLSISSLATASLYQAYPHSNPVAVTTYDREAAKFIDESTPVNYTVICDREFAEVGMTITGYFTSRGVYVAYWDTSMRYYYSQMSQAPSLGTMFAAAGYTNTEVVYFVVNRLRTENFDHVVEVASTWLDPYLILGEGTLYVFRWVVPTPIITSGVGPGVFIYNLQQSINTTYMLNLVTLDATYNVILNGSSVYNITGIPLEWSFESINPKPESLNMKLETEDRWVNFTGKADTSYTIAFNAWMLYKASWVDDSFSGPIVRSALIEEFFTDGDVAANVIRKPESMGRGLAWSGDIRVTMKEGYNYFLFRHRVNDTSIYALEVIFEKSDGETIHKQLTNSMSWKTDVIWLTDDEARGIVKIGLWAWVDSSITYIWYWDYAMFSKLVPPKTRG